jgi:hypothetical protein
MQSTCAVLHCHLGPVRLYNISPHYLIKEATFGGEGGGSYWTKMGVSIFSTILCETFLILRRIKRDTIENAHTSLRNATYSCQILIKSEFSRQVFENNSISNFMQIRHVRSRLFHTNARQRERARARTHTHTHTHAHKHKHTRTKHTHHKHKHTHTHAHKHTRTKHTHHKHKHTHTHTHTDRHYEANSPFSKICECA